MASIGAGVLQAAAAGAHRATAGAAVAFAVFALLQLGWGALGLGTRGRATAATGVVISGAALAGWIIVKTIGVAAISGLGDGDAIGWADGLAALLATTAMVLAARSLVAGLAAGGEGPAMTSPARSVGPSTGPPVPVPGSPRWSRRLVPTTAVAVAVLVGFALPTVHTHDHDHDHGPAVALAAYDPAAPVNFSGVFGVTPEEQARAERLVTTTLADLAAFADPAAARQAGYQSMGDAVTGTEHLIRWSAVGDDVTLDPSRPESLVYRTVAGRRPVLEAAQFLLPRDTTLAGLPDAGGSLTRWTQRSDLCFGGPRNAPTSAGLSGAGGACPRDMTPYGSVFALHVWVAPHPCGPFSDLEQVPTSKADAAVLCASGHAGH